MCRELKRVKDEEASRFTGGLVMNERYLLLKLIGKGGFSEVFQVCRLVCMLTLVTSMQVNGMLMV